MFKFRLEGVLNYRRRIEESLERELADINRLFDIEKNRLVSYKERRDRYQEEFRRKQVEGIGVDEIKLYLDFLEGLDKTIIDQDRIVTAVCKRVALKREEVLTAMKNRKILETMRARKWDEYRKKEMKAEQDFLDEIAGSLKKVKGGR
ncbi:MAG: flagellar export protein FliJ [Nitrospinota bacterium]